MPRRGKRVFETDPEAKPSVIEPVVEEQKPTEVTWALTFWFLSIDPTTLKEKVDVQTALYREESKAYFVMSQMVSNGYEVVLNDIHYFIPPHRILQATLRQL